MEDKPIVLRNRERIYVITDDCNCACSNISITQNNPLATQNKSTLRTSSMLETIDLSSSYKVTFIPSGDGIANNIAVINPQAWEILSAFKRSNFPAALMSIWRERWGNYVLAKILSDFSELKYLGESHRLSKPTTIGQSETLEIWLHITDECNLRCLYCYLPHKNINMSVEVGYKAVDAAFRSAINNNYRNIKIKYSGGEAMLRLPFVLELHQYAKALSRRTDIVYRGVILSNGTCLTPETVKKIRDEELNLVISLDGLGLVNDQQRYFSNGDSSSEKVTRAIDLAIAYGWLPDISITISKHNISELPRLVKWIIERNLRFKLSFYKGINKLSYHESLMLSKDETIRSLYNVFEVIESHLPSYSLLGALADTANLSVPHSHPCGAGHDYMVIDCFGQVFKCQMQMDEPIATVDAEDPLSFVRFQKNDILGISVDERSDCSNCKWRYWCAGGCPLEFTKSPGYYKSVKCEIYKAIYPEIIRLEGLRLLKRCGMGKDYGL